MGTLYQIDGDYLTSIADAIRFKGSTSASMYVADMASNIMAIPSGSSS